MKLKYFIWGGVNNACKYINNKNKNIIVAPVTEWCKTDKDKSVYLNDLYLLNKNLNGVEIAIKPSSFDFNLSLIKPIIQEKKNIWSFDAEESWSKKKYHNITNLMIDYYGLNIRKCYQAYLIDEKKKLMNDIDRFGSNYCIRLVRGAYHKLEIKKSTGAVYNKKEYTDKQFRDMMHFLVQEVDNPIMIATHNKDDLLWLKNNINKNNFERIKIGQLMGIGSNDKNVVKYLPYGNLKDAIPYLTRRLYENKSMITYII